MYEGNAVDLQMEKVIAADAILDDETHHCQERYQCEHGKILVFHIENGFYTISDMKGPVKRK